MLIRTRRYSLSKRGAVLGLFGFVYVALGKSYFDIPAAARPLLNQQLGVALRLAPVQFYGWAWIVAGTVALIGGLVHRLDAYGFMAATFMPGLWAVLYFLAWVHDDAPRAQVNAAIFAAIALALAIVAGMDDPIEPRPRRRQR